MKQINQLIDILKLELKRHGITYKQLANKLDMSEASIKRLFSVKEMSLSRLESICHVVELNLSDLFELLDKKEARIKHLSLEQESLLVNDELLMMIAVSVMNHWQFDEILEYYAISEHLLIEKLAQLDQMKLLELMPGNRIRNLLHPDFDWLANGPIYQFFNSTIKEDFFNSDFKGEGELLIMRSGMLSKQEMQHLHKLLKSTAKSFIESCYKEKKYSIHHKKGVALVLALRPWVPRSWQKKKLK